MTERRMNEEITFARHIGKKYIYFQIDERYRRYNVEKGQYERLTLIGYIKTKNPFKII